MKTLFLQISDIHWQASHSREELRFSSVGRVLPSHFVAQIEAIFFLYGGDFVHSGKSEEFDEVWERLIELEESVKTAFGPSIQYHSVGVPGNHDCDFAHDQSARDSLLHTLSRGKSPQLKGAITDILLKPQDAFFEFLDVLTGSTRHQLLTEADARIAWRHAHMIGDELLHINCFNSAWLSRMHERQGYLFLPAPNPDRNGPEVTLELSLLHHPFNWLSSSNSHLVRRRLLETSDLIFTGHEHTGATIHAELLSNGNASLHEALPFLGSESEDEGFTALFLDTSSKQTLQIDFIWQGGEFLPYQQGSRIEPQQSLLPLNLEINRYRKNRKWEFACEFEEFLENPELDLGRSDGIEVRLPDIFTCPDLRELRADTNYETSRTIEGSSALTEVIESEAVFLVGPDNCGKSAIAKMLMLHLRAEGLLPLLISGPEVSPAPDRLKALLSSRVDRQYGKHLSERYFNSPLSERALVIDDYHLISDRWRKEHQLLDIAKRFASRVFILSHDTELGLTDYGMFVLRPGPKVRVINIPPFTFERRASLIEKWLAISPTYGSDPEADQRKESECHNMVNTIVGQNYIQPFAPYILSVLQSIESGREVDLAASTHGHLYEVFIKTALARRRNQTNYNVTTAYIATLAIEAFEQEQDSFGMDFLRQAHSRFERETDLSRDIEPLVKELVEVRLLAERNSEFSFRERYIYYYFVAFYLKDRLSEAGAQRIVGECARKAWVQDYANVLLFLAHLSKDHFIVETILQAARATFANITPARLEGELSVLLEKETPSIELPDDRGEDKEARTQEQKQVADESQLAHLPYPLRRNTTSEEIGLVGQLSAALKTLQILGQLLKNFPANFEPSQKVEMVNECIDLGLRSLGHYFQFAEEGKATIMRSFTEMIKVRLPGLNDVEARAKAGVAIGNLCHLASFGIIKRISYAIGSTELAKTYEKVFAKGQSPARLLVQISMELDRMGDFPERAIVEFAAERSDNFFAVRVLRHLVVRHFRLFNRNFKLRQRIGEKIGISYRRTVGKVSEKLLGPSIGQPKASTKP